MCKHHWQVEDSYCKTEITETCMLCGETRKQIPHYELMLEDKHFGWRRQRDGVEDRGNNIQYWYAQGGMK